MTAGTIRKGRRAGLALIRVDGPAQNPPAPTEPHINLNRELTGFKDPHTVISPAALERFGKGALALETANKISGPVAIATDVARLGLAYESDGGTIGQNTQRTAASVAGGWAGAFAGAKLGAGFGALAGGVLGNTIAPVLGGVAGAGVGGFAGGIIGGIWGAYHGSRYAEKVYDFYHGKQ